MNKLILILILVLAACDVGNSQKNSNTADSNNDNSVNVIGDSDRACSLCSSRKYLEENYDVERYINCTEFCDLPANGNPEKVQCDIDCINDRLVLAKEDCEIELDCIQEEEEEEEVEAVE